MPKVLLGISGGCDSVVSAWKLQRDGYDIMAVTLLYLDVPEEQEKYARAAYVCERLGIEYTTIDVREFYQGAVVEPFKAAYGAGLENDPNVNATRTVLLSMLMGAAHLFECDKIATGHYARITTDYDGPGVRGHQLLIPRDEHFDETYYLYGLSQEQLARFVFPLADMGEPQVRQTAMRAGLMMPRLHDPGLKTPFVPDDDVASWLEREGVASCEPGDIVMVGNNKVLGTHHGLHRYPVGAPLEGHTDAQGELLHVVAKDVLANRLYVAPFALSGQEGFMVRDVTWTSIEPITQKRSCKARIAWQARPIPVQLVPLGEDRVSVTFNDRGVSVGQGETVVFYSDKLVLGGGIVA